MNYVTQSLIQSNEIYNATSGQRRTSDHLARFDGRHYQQEFETDAGHCRGPYEPAAPEHTINLEGANWETTTTEHRLGQKDPPHVRSRSRPRSIIHRLDGEVHGVIQQSNLLCDGLLHLRLQLR
jgi:hypothetical protein